MFFLIYKPENINRIFVSIRDLPMGFFLPYNIEYTTATYI